VPVWVNPSNPHESIIDRSLRPGLLAFKMVFVVMFGGFGVGLLFFVWRGRKVRRGCGRCPRIGPALAGPGRMGAGPGAFEQAL